MDLIRKWIRNVFGFSRNEINGFLILIPLMLLLILSEPVYRKWVASSDRLYERDVQALDSLIAQWEKQTPRHQTPVIPAASLSSFDPNSASLKELRSLGFSEISAKRIAAYRAKGGVFTIKSDLLKIYGLDSSLYKQLYDYIRLPSQHLPTAYADATRSANKFRRSGEKRVKKSFDLNTADTLLLESVFGIGPKLASRIIKFRHALGGFVKEEQLYEVYGLDSVVVNRLLEVAYLNAEFVPEKLNINTADEKVLSAHPYIRYKIANALVRYRFHHGDFLQTSDIKNLSVLQPHEVERLLPYLKVKD